MFKSHSKAVAIVLALVLTISMCCMSVTAANEATPTDTQTITVQQGDVIEYSVYMTVPEEFIGVQFAIDYGSNLELSSDFQSASASDLVKMLMPTFTSGSTMANPSPVGYPNQIWGSNIDVSGGYDFTDSGLLATVTLVAKESGTANITASVSEIYNYDLDALMSVTTLNGEAEVVSSSDPTEAPTDEPTEAPTDEPTEAPTDEPTEAPTDEPTEAPTDEPTEAPTDEPTEAPTDDSTEVPTDDSTDATNATGATSSSGSNTTGGGSSTTTGGGSSTATGKVATGDSTSVAALLVVLMAAAGVVVFARKRVKD